MRNKVYNYLNLYLLLSRMSKRTRNKVSYNVGEALDYLALKIRAAQRSITTKMRPLTTHIDHVMLIMTLGSSKKSFLLLLPVFPRNYFERSWTCFLGI